MNVDALLQGLIDEHQDLLLPFVRKAYEAGYRDGLATRPGAPEAAAAPAAPSAVPPARLVIEDGKLVADPAPTDGAGSPSTSGGRALFADDDDTDGDSDEDDVDDGSAVRDPFAIRTSMTIGGLLKRIERSFRLDRFDILVRIENPATHRHLKRSVRLSQLLKEVS